MILLQLPILRFYWQHHYFHCKKQKVDFEPCDAHTTSCFGLLVFIYSGVGGKPITVAYYQRINYNVTCGRAQTSNNIAGSWFGCCCRPIPFAPRGRTTAAVSLSVPLCVDSVGGCVRSQERLWRQHCECIVAVGCNNKLNWGHRRLPLLSAGGRLRFYDGVVCCMMCMTARSWRYILDLGFNTFLSTYLILLLYTQYVESVPVLVLSKIL